MASAFKRHRKGGTFWYGKYLDPATDTWKVKALDATSKNLANVEIANHQKKADEDHKRGVVPEIPKIGDLVEKWMRGLTNRNADEDRRSVRNHLLPYFAEMKIDALTQVVVMGWLDELKTRKKRRKGKPADPNAATISGSTQRGLMNLLSRFCGWAVARGHLQINPVRTVPHGERPRQAAKTSDMPWIEDDAIVRRIMGALKRPADLAFYLGNRSGLRVGELCGLRMSDLAELEHGRIRVRFSYESCLKEDKGEGTGKTKWVPAPIDAPLALKAWLEQRKAEGAGPEDFVFPRVRKVKGERSESCHTKQFLEKAWGKARKVLATGENKFELKLTFYAATRHSFVSRNLADGASIDEVSTAVGHSSPVVTRRYYDHFVRRDFSDTLRTGLGLTGSDVPAEVIPFKQPPKGRGARRGAPLQSAESSQKKKAQNP